LREFKNDEKKPHPSPPQRRGRTVEQAIITILLLLLYGKVLPFGEGWVGLETLF
jgi:hypothetical protein